MKLLLTYLLLILISTTVHSQERIMLPEQERLSAFKGHWTIEGNESTYLEICEWIQGNHIQCISASKEKTGIDSSVSYLSYSAPEKCYIYYGLYPSGNSRTLRGLWQQNKFIFEGQRITSEKVTKWRVTITQSKKACIL